MNSYIPHRILVINQQITKNADDEALLQAFRLAFDWANRMGQEGKRVFDLYLQRPDINNYNPLANQSYLWCKIECTQEERERWDEIQKVNVTQAVLKAMSED
jgi:hypothetical protein